MANVSHDCGTKERDLCTRLFIFDLGAFACVYGTFIRRRNANANTGFKMALFALFYIVLIKTKKHYEKKIY